MAENDWLEFILNLSHDLLFISISLHSESHAAACAGVLFFLCAGMKGLGPVTIPSLCCTSERETPGLAPVTQLLIALVLSLVLTSLTCCRSISAIAYLPHGISSSRLLQPKSTNHKPLFVLFFLNPKTVPTSLGIPHLESLHCPITHVTPYEDVLVFNPTKSDFILWLWRRDVRSCAHLKLHWEGSGEMHSFASLATDVGKSIFPLRAEPCGVSKNSALWTVGQLFCPQRLK